MPDTHFFNVPLAVRYGQENSLVLSHLCYWIRHNAQNNTNFFDKRYWTYNTLGAFQKQFPYFTASQIRTILNNLKKSGAVVTGNFNRRAFDRTLWYSVSDEVLSVYEGNNAPPEPEPAGDGAPPPDAAPICQISQMHLRNPANAFAESRRPIPDLNKYIKTESTSAATASQKPRQVAAESRINELKVNFCRIDQALVFDEAFYSKALSVLEKYRLDNNYLSWLYDFCKKKKPGDLTAYYFSVFREESLIKRFIASETAPTPPRNSACPVCGESRPEFAVCPSCGFSGGRDPQKIAAAAFLFNMPPDVRSRYDNELASIPDTGPFEKRVFLLRALRKKYGVPE